MTRRAATSPALVRSRQPPGTGLGAQHRDAAPQRRAGGGLQRAVQPQPGQAPGGEGQRRGGGAGAVADRNPAQRDAAQRGRVEAQHGQRGGGIHAEEFAADHLARGRAALQQQHLLAGAGERDGRGAAGRAGADDDRGDHPPGIAPG